jgi:hypothetical protein
MTNRNTKTVVAIALAALLVSAGAANVLAAKPSIDNETTNTPSTSELTDGSTINISDGGINDSDYHYVQYTADSANSSVEITLNGTDDEGGAVFYENKTAETIDSASDTYRVNFSERVLADVPRAINENVTLDLTITNDTEAENPDTTTIQVHLQNGDDRSVVYVSGADVSSDEDDDIIALNKSKKIAGFEYSSTDYAKVSGLNRDVNGSATEVAVIYGNDSVASDYSEAVASDAGSGDWVLMQAAALDGTPVKVYNDAASDNVDEGDSYGVYESDIGGESGTVYHLGDDYSDASSVEIESYGNKDYSPMSFWDVTSAFGTWNGIKATSTWV